MAGGHIKSITVLYTAEIELRPVTGGSIQRKSDPETGTGLYADQKRNNGMRTENWRRIQPGHEGADQSASNRARALLRLVPHDPSRLHRQSEGMCKARTHPPRMDKRRSL